MLKGLLVVGEFAGTEKVKKSSGEVIPGFYRISVDVGTSYTKDAAFFEVDQDSGEKSRVATQLDDLELRIGERIAIRVAPRASGKYVNLDAVNVVALDREDVAAL